VSSSTEVFGDHWEAGSVETHLPYRDVVANDLNFSQFSWIMADREWIVGMMALVRPFLFRGGPFLEAFPMVNLITRAPRRDDRKDELRSLCTM
jgi:hypothetical protein